MKKLLLLSVVLFLFAACSKEETTDSGRQADPNTAFVPHLYGAAMLEHPAPATRGVANAMKVWSKPMAAENLTVKFLNGTDRYKAFVKEAAKEWEKAAGVRLQFVSSDKDAVIRVGFDYVPGMMSSWALTGTDHMQVYGQQTEPTVHFAQWRRASDLQKRSDVLRAFGQALGLELEFRHPSFHPAWITNADGSVNETAIKEYWENELADCITWDELKKIVLEPLSSQAFFINKTEEYDPESVMNWPFYEMIAHNIPPIEFDEDYKSELSIHDKEFIQSLYGESFGETVEPARFFPLIEFEYTGYEPSFTVTTTKNLGVYWDYKVTNEYTQYDLPTDAASSYTITIDHTFAEAKTRKIVIGEVLDYGTEMPMTSTALTKFDLKGGHTGEIDIKKLNHALTYVRIIGEYDFTPRELNFTGYNYLKELYLVAIRDSKVVVDDCKNLETFATSPYIWKPGMSFPENAPYIPMRDRPGYIYSLDDASGGLTILNCNKLKTISLERTNVTNFNFGNLPALEYVYLSSEHDYIVGGGTPQGQWLQTSVNTLINRNEGAGSIVIRGIGEEAYVTPGPPVEIPDNKSVGMFVPAYKPIDIDRTTYNAINQNMMMKNWKVVWEPGVILH